ncbi:MAG TPA: class II aldolase/adducin family protein [Phenylobacterium sp.]|uniref:class II aldolase/adducin family protein n=1 Tax=Phenylobacterium sp. TaxID=1871053 RepID=UPI002B47CC1B|nr:class II aldolase/adducin family protein [Phenylobacterium sp.]HKR90132.1 class II aldolase/adducin family protein [Phenylobacterium sp.]
MNASSIRSPAEAELRRDLAAAYRLTALYGWDDLVATHISVRLPQEEAFLINPFGMLFEEIRPADLVKVDMEGKVLEPTPWSVNLAGFVIHSAIHAARHDVVCAMHLHTPDGIAVSALKEGLLPLSQTALLLAGEIAYHEFEGIALRLDERERLVADLGDKNVLVLRNHGTLTLGATIADAFTTMYFLESACRIQVRALAMDRPLNPIGPEAVERMTQLQMSRNSSISRDLAWPALLRRLDRIDPGWSGEG